MRQRVALCDQKDPSDLGFSAPNAVMRLPLLLRERLCEIGEATGFQRRLVNGGVVVPGDIDDRHQNSSRLETTPQLDPGFIVQVDVHDDTQRFFEIVVVLKSLGRGKQDTVVTVLPQQSLYSPEHAGVVIDDKNDISIWHDR